MQSELRGTSQAQAKASTGLTLDASPRTSRGAISAHVLTQYHKSNIDWKFEVKDSGPEPLERGWIKSCSREVWHTLKGQSIASQPGVYLGESMLMLGTSVHKT